MGRTTVYNKLYNEEAWNKSNPENKQLVADFLEYLKSIDRADSTIAQYENDLRIFMCWNWEFNNDKSYINLTKREIAKFQYKALNEYNWSSNRIRRFKSTLSSFGNYIEDILDDEYQGYRSIVNKIANPAKEPVREKTVFTDDELESLLQQLKDNGEYERMMAVALALYSGRRKQELPRFKMDFFTDDNVICGSLYKTPKIKTKGRGSKGKVINTYVLKHKFDPYLEIWKKYREENGIESEWLLHNPVEPSEPLPVSTLDSWAKLFTRRLGKPFYWHSLRHRWTTAMGELGLPTGVIQKLQSWESADMVAIYSDRDIDDELAEYFNEDGIVARKAKSLTDLG